MAKNIAVLMGLINMENQREIMDGMIEAIKKTEDNVYIFTNHSSRQDNKENAQGAYHIMELPDFKYFDGAIVVMDTMTYQPAVSYLMDRLRASKIPFITLNQQIEGHGCIQSSTYEAQYKMVDHLIKTHGCKDIAYVRGPQNYSEADKRFSAYLDVLNDNDIPFREEYVFQGMFTLESGIHAAVQLHSSGLKVDAVVCASDNMAVGVLEYYKMVGVKVPDDVLLVGFDNSEMAMYSNPTISSIDKNPYELGFRSIGEILAIVDGKEPEVMNIAMEPCCRASCGCKKLNDIDVEKLKYKYIQKDIYTNHLSEMINNNLAEFSVLQTPEEVIPVLKKTIHRISLKAFYLCLCERDKVFALPESNMSGNLDIMQVNTDYTEMIELPLAYENGVVCSYKAFPRGMVLPEEIRSREGGNYYVVTPVYFQNCCYGYVVSGNDKLALKTTLYYSWLTNIGVAYENIRKRMLLQDAVIRLNNIWSYDMLTELYNRAGFYYEAKTILELLKMQNSKIFVLFSDVDGLKKVNDTLGHEAGDLLIKEMAACFKENLTADMLAMRYGGDEFVVFGPYEDEMEIDYLLNGIQASMDRRNATGENSFELATSIGVTKYNAADVNELSEIIDIADANMYEQKRKKREQKKLK